MCTLPRKITQIFNKEIKTMKKCTNPLCIHKGKLQPLSNFYKNKTYKNKPSSKCKICYIEGVKKNSETDAGKESIKVANKKYRKSEKGKKVLKKYLQSDKGKESVKKSKRKYYKSDKGKKAKKKYLQSDKGKKAQKKAQKKFNRNKLKAK